MLLFRDSSISSPDSPLFNSFVFTATSGFGSTRPTTTWTAKQSPLGSERLFSCWFFTMLAPNSSPGKLHDVNRVPGYSRASPRQDAAASLQLFTNHAQLLNGFKHYEQAIFHCDQNRSVRSTLKMRKKRRPEKTKHPDSARSCFRLRLNAHLFHFSSY